MLEDSRLVLPGQQVGDEICQHQTERQTHHTTAQQQVSVSEDGKTGNAVAVLRLGNK